MGLRVAEGVKLVARRGHGRFSSTDTTRECGKPRISANTRQFSKNVTDSLRH